LEIPIQQRTIALKFYGRARIRSGKGSPAEPNPVLVDPVPIEPASDEHPGLFEYLPLRLIHNHQPLLFAKGNPAEDPGVQIIVPGITLMNAGDLAEKGAEVRAESEPKVVDRMKRSKPCFTGYGSRWRWRQRPSWGPVD
jgi:hypothetical protein